MPRCTIPTPDHAPLCPFPPRFFALQSPGNISHISFSTSDTTAITSLHGSKLQQFGSARAPQSTGRRPIGGKFTIFSTGEGIGQLGILESGIIELSDGLVSKEADNVMFVEKDYVLGREKFVKDVNELPAAKLLEMFNFSGEFPSIYDFNNVLAALVKAEKLQSAVNMFDELAAYKLLADSRTFSIMVRCFCKKNEPDNAAIMLHSMIELGCSPNVITFTVLIDSCCKKGKLEKAFGLLETMSKVGCEPTVRTYNCLMKGLCFVGRLEKAFKLLVKMKEGLKKPDIYTYTLMMDGFGKVGRTDEGMELLEEAITMGLKPTVHTFNTLLTGYCKEGRPLDGIRVFHLMDEQCCRPDYISYCTLLYGLLKWNHGLAGLNIYEAMSNAGFVPNEQMVNTLLRRVCRKSFSNRKLLDNVEELCTRVKEIGYNLSSDTYCFVIEAFSCRGQTHKALSKLQEMLRLGYTPKKVTFDCIVRALCNEGKVTEAWLILMLMVDGSVTPNQISYSLLVSKLNQQRRWSDACKVYGYALKRGVNPVWKVIHGGSEVESTHGIITSNL